MAFRFAMMVVEEEEEERRRRLREEGEGGESGKARVVDQTVGMAEQGLPRP